MGSKRYILLEDNDVLARDGVFDLRNSEKGGHSVKGCLVINLDIDWFYSAFCLFTYVFASSLSPLEVKCAQGDETPGSWH